MTLSNSYFYISFYKNAFKKIFIQHLKREELKEGEQSILSTAITVLLWRIQNKKFREIATLRYNYITKRDERRRLARQLEQGEISEEEYQQKIPIAEFSEKADTIPNIKRVDKVPLFKGIKADEVPYDLVVYDTYDYLDKVISFSLSDPLCAAFELYFNRTKDIRAKSMSNYIRYGTDDKKEIWLLRYGFEFETIEWLTEHILSIDEDQIVFNENVNSLPENKFAEIERYIDRL
jgi:hypothetical protein